MTRILRLALVLAAVLAAAPSAAFTIAGKVVGVADGDTLTILDASRRQNRIRLARIDSPEVGRGKNKPTQPFAERARQSLAQLAFGREARAECDTTDQYKRSVCTILVDGADVNLEQVRRGIAWVYRRYAGNAPAYYQAEREAREAKRGLWADSRPVPPWEWRQRGKRW